MRPRRPHLVPEWPRPLEITYRSRTRRAIRQTGRILCALTLAVIPTMLFGLIFEHMGFTDETVSFLCFGVGIVAGMISMAIFV